MTQTTSASPAAKSKEHSLDALALLLRGTFHLNSPEVVRTHLKNSLTPAPLPEGEGFVSLLPREKGGDEGEEARRTIFEIASRNSGASFGHIDPRTSS